MHARKAHPSKPQPGVAVVVGHARASAHTLHFLLSRHCSHTLTVLGRGALDAGKCPRRLKIILTTSLSPLRMGALRPAASGAARSCWPGARGAMRQSVLYSRPAYRGFRGATFLALQT